MTNLLTFFANYGSEKLISKNPESITLSAKHILKTGSLHVLKTKSKQIKKSCVFLLDSKYLYYVNSIIQSDKSSTTFISNGKIELAWKYVIFDHEAINDDNSKFMYCIQILKKNTKVILATNDYDDFVSWKSLMRGLSIQTDFFDKYGVKGIIGEGATAKVYKVIDKLTGEELACKRFKKTTLDSPKIIQALASEIEQLRLLNGYKNIIGLKEVFESENSIYIVSELCEGGRLIEKLRPYSSQDVEQLAVKLLGILKYLKDKNVVHRDLKPANILLKFSNVPIQNNIIKLVDFGLAIQKDTQDILFPHCGTLGYLPPEALVKNNNFRPDFSFDIFSVGIILYNAITGGRAFWHDDQKIMLERNREGQLNMETTLFNQASLKCNFISKKSNY